MITTAIRATIRPYSMAVAPDSSFTKRETNLVMAFSPVASLVSGFKPLGLLAPKTRPSWGILLKLK
jgi:hypothetical protein